MLMAAARGASEQGAQRSPWRTNSRRNEDPRDQITAPLHGNRRGFGAVDTVEEPRSRHLFPGKLPMPIGRRQFNRAV